MDQPGQHARRFQEWTQELPADVQTTWDLMNNPLVAQPGRRFLAGALSYILTQLDLIPDHEKAGAIDDVFVIRVAYGLAAEHTSKLGTREASQVARFTHDEDEIRAFCGDPLFAKLRRYVVELADKPVRGRTTDQILSDEKARADMRRELDQSTKRFKPAIAVNDAEAQAIEVSVKSYLKMKLGA
jgi:uncharacterized membrane protein YkvA (DUF1232 family)